MGVSVAAGRRVLLLHLFGLVLVLVLAVLSLNVGASKMKLIHLFTQPDDRVTQILFASRLPRTIALILAGAALAVSGLLMQMMARNRLLEPATVGVAAASSTGMLVAAIVAPGLSQGFKFGLVSLFAAGGTVLFLAVTRKIALRSALIVPLLGLVLASVIHSGNTLLAHQFELSQALRAWSSGDFSAILRDRYELLWIAAGLTGLAMWLADRFTVVGMGKDFATNIGVNYAALMGLGVVMVSIITASVVVTVGVLPFIGIVVPYAVTALTGAALRKNIGLVALGGAVVMLAADLLARLLIHPYEVPSANLLGIAGSFALITILLKGRRQWV